MIRRINLKTTLLLGAVVFGALYGVCNVTWARTGSYPVVRRSRGEFYRIHLQAPAEETRFGALEVPEEIFNQTFEGDIVEFKLRSFQPLGMEAIDYRLLRAGVPAVEWKEGYVFFWAGLGGVSFLGGVVLSALVGLLAAIFNLGKPPEV